MALPKLEFTVSCAPLAADDVAFVIDWLERNPFTPPLFMIDDAHGADDAPKRYQRQALAAVFKPRKDADVTLFSHSQNLRVEADLRQTSRGASLSFSVADVDLAKRAEAFLQHAQSLVARLPTVSSGRIGDGNADWPALYQQLGLLEPPACFTTHLRWVHFLGSEYSGMFISTDDLLAAPAYRVEQLPSGVVQLICYPNPFAWNNKEARAYLRELTDHLNASDLFMQDIDE